MSYSRTIRAVAGSLLCLVAGAALTSIAWAQNTQSERERPASAAATIKTWESAEERLTMLLGQVPEQARPGIERAIAANREGRQKAEEALSRGDERRAARALELAASRAESGLNQARSHVPASVLPRLDEAAAKMSAPHGPAAASGLKTEPAIDASPAQRPGFERPGVGTPSMPNRPDNAATPPPHPGPP